MPHYDQSGRPAIFFHVADVHTSLLSITRAADVGYECHLNAEGGYQWDTITGESFPIGREGNFYTMEAWAQGSNA